MSKSATLSRKERLAKIRAAKLAKDGGSASSSSSTSSINSKKRQRPTDDDINLADQSTTNKDSVKFRNYDPATGSQKTRRLDNHQPPSVAAELKVSNAVAVAAAPRDQSAPIVVVQKKIDWDLKRDIEPQLKIIERRTRIAIREILKQQLQG